MATNSNNDNVVNSLISQDSKDILNESSLKLFKEIKPDDLPLIPLPPDNCSDMNYPQFIEVRCSICSSQIRDLA